MSELIAARAKGELLERYEDEKESLGEDETESELVRDLLDRGLRDRRVPLVARLDLPNRVGARIEDERERGESEEEVVRRFLREAVDARDADALDAIGADEELRELVEARREEGESLDDTVRRLIREGGERDTVVDMVHRLGADQAMAVPVTALLLAFIPWLGAWVLQSTNVELALVLFILGAILQFAAAVGIVIVALASVASGAAYHNIPRRVMSALGR